MVPWEVCLKTFWSTNDLAHSHKDYKYSSQWKKQFAKAPGRKRWDASRPGNVWKCAALDMLDILVVFCEAIWGWKAFPFGMAKQTKCWCYSVGSYLVPQFIFEICCAFWNIKEHLQNSGNRETQLLELAVKDLSISSPELLLELFIDKSILWQSRYINPNDISTKAYKGQVMPNTEAWAAYVSVIESRK